MPELNVEKLRDVLAKLSTTPFKDPDLAKLVEDGFDAFLSAIVARDRLFNDALAAMITALETMQAIIAKAEKQP